MEATKNSAWIPWAIVGFFAFFMVLLSNFAWIAFHTYPGQVTEEAYKKGLAYNNAIASADAQAKLGWKTTLQTTQKNNDVGLVFTLLDASGQPIDNAEVSVRASRVTQAGHDVQITLKPNAKGAYSGTMKLDWPGAWELRISATRGADNFQQSKTVTLQ